MLEWKLPNNFSIEIDGLWRTYPYGPDEGAAVTWEMPVLAKYRFRLPFGRPFLDCWALISDWAATVTGFSAGAGVEFRVIGPLNIAPTLRYTHWGSRDDLSFDPNLVELLAALRFSSEGNAHPISHRVSLGVVLGSTLSPDFPTVSSPGTFSIPNIPVFIATSVFTAGPQSFLIAPSVAFQLPLDLSIEIDAVRRPIPERSYLSVPPGTLIPAQTAAVNALALPPESLDITGEFPVLAKFKFSRRRVTPVIALDPSFRLPQNSSLLDMLWLVQAPKVRPSQIDNILAV